MLLKRIVTQPNEGELVAIYNPTEDSINLSNYYISDDNNYYKIALHPDSTLSNYPSGFTAQFPNINIKPKETLNILFNEKYKDYYGESIIAHLVMFGKSDTSLTGNIGSSNNKIAESSELIILFKWDGIDNIIYDVDYFIWGAYQQPINKESPIYQNDTNPNEQLNYTISAESYYAYSRINDNEIGEIEKNGNGIFGNDETSENFRKSWGIIRMPEFTFGCSDLYAINFNPYAKYEINTVYELSKKLFNFDPNITCRYSFEEILNNKFEIGYNKIKIYGKVVDFFDVRTVSSTGPQNITIEDEYGYRLTITIWDWEIINSHISQILTEYNKNEYYLWATGELSYYEKYDEWQIEVTTEENIIIANNFSYNGKYEVNPISTKTSINPAPYIIIPTLNETLDYNFTFPNQSRVIIRIFDISGRFITSLIDKYYEKSGTVFCNDPPASWNGRDHLGQIVLPGTYILHIETINPITGQVFTDSAPIVVGAK